MEYPLIYIRWVDAYEPTNLWRNIDDIDDLIEDDWIVEQTGWVYKETDEFLVLINMCSDSNGCVSHITKIPKPWVKHREEIKLKCRRTQKTI